MDNKKKIIFALLAVLFFSGYGVWYFRPSHKKSDAVVVPALNGATIVQDVKKSTGQEPATVSTDTVPADWKTFSDPDSGLSLRLPASFSYDHDDSWTVATYRGWNFELTFQDEKAQRTVTAESFTDRTVKDWLLQEGAVEGVGGLVFQRRKDSHGTYNPYIALLENDRILQIEFPNSSGTEVINRVLGSVKMGNGKPLPVSPVEYRVSDSPDKTCMSYGSDKERSVKQLEIRRHGNAKWQVVFLAPKCLSIDGEHLSFSPNGRYALVTLNGYEDQRTMLIDIVTVIAKDITDPEGYDRGALLPKPIQDAVWSRDSRYLAVTSTEFGGLLIGTNGVFISDFGSGGELKNIFKFDVDHSLHSMIKEVSLKNDKVLKFTAHYIDIALDEDAEKTIRYEYDFKTDKLKEVK